MCERRLHCRIVMVASSQKEMKSRNVCSLHLRSAFPLRPYPQVVDRFNNWVPGETWLLLDTSRYDLEGPDPMPYGEF